MFTCLENCEILLLSDGFSRIVLVGQAVGKSETDLALNIKSIG